MLHAFHIAL